MNKGYIEKQYEQIVLEWRCATSEDEKWKLRQRMVQLEETASVLFGMAYMDELHKKYVDEKILGNP